jgi:hypothetical protein
VTPVACGDVSKGDGMKSDTAATEGTELFIPIPAYGEGFNQELVCLPLQCEAFGVFFQPNIRANSGNLFPNSSDPAFSREFLLAS